MEPHILEILWYIVFIVVMIGYAVLDGFDLGVGSLHLMARDDRERRLFLNAIGPVWDGNEVWLVIVGGALFAGFPFVYATLMSGFYVLIMALLFCLIVRAVSIEFRSKAESKRWRSVWDVAFSFASIGIALGLGLFLGNLAAGIPLDVDQEYYGGFLPLFTPYTVILAVTALALFMMHGSIYLVMKTEGHTHDHMRQWVRRTMVFFIMMYAIANSATLIYMPHLVERFQEHRWLFIVPVLVMFAIANIPREIAKGHDGHAFISSAATIAGSLILYAISTFPVIVRSTNDPAALSLTIHNSYASLVTLKILLIIVLIGIPVVLAYTISIYYLFRGKVKLDSTSY